MAKESFYDNTMISCFRSCPRKYYFRHVKHWEPEGFAPALAFGSAWHSAMDFLWSALSGLANKRSTEEIAKISYAMFLKKWIESGGPDPDETSVEDLALLGARHPMNALEMLYNYIEERRDFLNEIELLEVERPFAVPLDPNRSLFYAGRLDKDFRLDRKVNICEHKTTSLYAKSGGFRTMFLDSFSPNSQVDGYLHALHMRYDALKVKYGKEAGSVWIDAALVHKEHHNIFKFIPIDRQINQLDSWLWETRSWIDQIEADQERLEDQTTNRDIEPNYMSAFPKNTSACQDYNRNCEYLVPCKAWSNPINKPCPPDMKVEKWSPFDRLELEKIGMEQTQ